MRVDKRRLTTALAKYLLNPVVKIGVTSGLLRGWAILGTTPSGSSRRTGAARATCKTSRRTRAYASGLEAAGARERPTLCPRTFPASASTASVGGSTQPPCGR